MRHVCVLDVVVLGRLDQILKLLNRLWRRCRNVHVLHFKTEVPLGDQSMGALIDLLDQSWIDDDTKLLSILVLLVKHGDALADRLVVVNVQNRLDEVADVELFLQLKMEDGSRVQKFHVDIRTILFDLIVDAVKCSKLVSCHSVLQIILGILNIFKHSITAANWAFRDLTILVLEDPSLG